VYKEEKIVGKNNVQTFLLYIIIIKNNREEIMNNIKFIVLSILILVVAGCSSLSGRGKESGIEVTASYREKTALLPGAVVVATLEDVSKMDAPSKEIGRTETTGENPPYKITINYSEKDIIEGHRYSVRVKIVKGEKLLFTSTEAYDPFTEEEKIIILTKIR